MTRAVKLSRLSTLLDSLDYPLTRGRIADEIGDVTVLLADGETTIDAVVDDLPSEWFDSRSELETEFYQFLPIAAVGEPGQSEGDA